MEIPDNYQIYVPPDRTEQGFDPTSAAAESVYVPNVTGQTYGGGFDAEELLDDGPVVMMQPEGESTADGGDVRTADRPDSPNQTAEQNDRADKTGKVIDDMDAPFLEMPLIVAGGRTDQSERVNPSEDGDNKRSQEWEVLEGPVEYTREAVKSEHRHPSEQHVPREAAVTVEDEAARVLVGEVIGRGGNAVSYDDEIAGSARAIHVGHPEVMDYAAYQALANIAELRQDTLVQRQDDNTRQGLPRNSNMPAPIEVVVADFTSKTTYLQHYADQADRHSAAIPRYIVDSVGVFDPNGPLSHLPNRAYAEIISGAAAATMAKDDTEKRLLMREVVLKAVRAIQGTPADRDHNPAIPHIAKVHQAVLTQRPGVLWGEVGGVQSDVPNLTVPEQMRLRDAFPAERKEEYKAVITPLVLWLESAASCAPPPNESAVRAPVSAAKNGYNGPLPMKIRRFEIMPGDETAEKFQADVMQRVLPAIVEGRTELPKPNVVYARGAEPMLESGSFSRLRDKAEGAGIKLMATASRLTEDTTKELFSENGIGETMVIARQSSPQAQLVTGALPTITRWDGQSTSYAIHFAEGGSRSQGDSWSWGQNHVGDDPDGGGRTGGRDRNQNRTGDVNLQLTEAPGPLVLPKEVENLGEKELIIIRHGLPPRVFNVVTREMERTLEPEDHSTNPVVLAARGLAERAAKPLEIHQDDDVPALGSGPTQAPQQNDAAPKPPTGVGARDLAEWQIERDARAAYALYRQNRTRRRDERRLSYEEWYPHYRNEIRRQRGY